jgi:transposase
MNETLEEFYSHLLGVESPWEVEEIKRDSETREVFARVIFLDEGKLRCPVCNQEAALYDHRTRRWRHLDSCNHRTIIESDVPRVKCEEHGIKQVPVPWAERNSRFTTELERAVCLWLRTAPIKEVASMFQMSWDEVSGIQERAVKRGIKNRKLIKTTQIGVDETSYQKRHEYVTIILDKDTDTVIDVLQDRKAETLGTWFKTQNMADLQGLKSISMDMWDPFIKAVRENITDANNLICFDRYHVSQHFNKAVDKVRASESRHLQGAFGESILAKTKYEWLRNSNLTDNRTGKRPSFMPLTKMNLKTARAWRIKEMASMLWNYEYLGVALKLWKRLLRWISLCRLKPVMEVGEMIRSYFFGIENAIRLKANNAMLESKNNGIQRIKKIACGFRNRERFRMAILFHFGGLDMGFSPTR